MNKNTPLWIAIVILAAACAAAAGYMLHANPSAAPIQAGTNAAAATSSAPAAAPQKAIQPDPKPQAGTTSAAPVAQGAPCSITSRLVAGSSEVYIGWASDIATQGYVFERSAKDGDSYHLSTQVPGWFRAAATPGTHTEVLQVIKDNQSYECSTTYTVN